MLFLFCCMRVAASVILKPLISSVVNIETLAEQIVDRAIPRASGLRQLDKFLAAALKETAKIDLATYRRGGSTRRFMDEINEVVAARNKVVHQAMPCDKQTINL